MLACLLLTFLCICEVQSQTIRLVSQSGRTRTAFSGTINGGRLEVFLNNQWGTVCDDLFSSNDATVACRQLGFDGFIGYDNAEDLGYGSTTRPILLDNLACSSFDSTLSECSSNGIGVHNCAHSEDIILSCREENSLRLATTSSGTSNTFFGAGRLEIYIRGSWGTVCDDRFTTTSANVACQQMGFSSANSWTYIGAQSRFPSAFSSAETWLDEVRCSSFDTRLINCQHNGVGNEDCAHSEDVVLFCESSSSNSLSPGTATSAAVVGIVVGSILYALFLCCPIIICIIVGVCSSNSSRRRRNVNVTAVPATSAVVATTTTTYSQPAQPAQPAQYPGYSTAPQQPPPPHSGVLQDAPPPAYDAAVAYPPPSYPVQNQPPQQEIPLQNVPYPPTNQPPQAYPSQPQAPPAPYPSDPAYPPPVGYPGTYYPDPNTAPSAPPA